MNWTGGKVFAVVFVALVVGGVVGATLDTLNARLAQCGRIAASCTGNSMQVVVATQDVDPYTKLDPLIEAGAFKTITVPDAAAVANAVTSTDQLRGLETFDYLYANEHIPLGRLGEPCRPPKPPEVCIDACC